MPRTKRTPPRAAATGAKGSSKTPKQDNKNNTNKRPKTQDSRRTTNTKVRTKQAERPKRGTTRSNGTAKESRPSSAKKAEPDGFRLTNTEVQKKTNGKNGKPKWRTVCSHLRVTALVRDSNNEKWGRLLEVRDRDGQIHEWAMPMSLLAGDGAPVREQLLNLGLVIENRKDARSNLNEYISKARPIAFARCVSQIGWHDDLFVLPDVTFGNTSSERVLLQTDAPFEHAFYTRGTLEEWQNEIARYAVNNSRVILGLTIAFAPPLLRMVGQQSGGVHLISQSSTGKTTVLECGGSVCGGGGKRGTYVDQWRATDNGLEAVAVAHSDTLLCLDEISQIDPKDAAKTAYMLSNESGKHRANQRGGSQPVAHWRVSYLSSGEFSLAEKIAEDKNMRKATAGQQVRVVDVPADAGAGLGLFEELHGFKSAAALSDHLKAAARKYYGTAMRGFLQGLFNMGLQHACDFVRAQMEQFLIEHCPEDASGQVRRVADRFALIAAAGELAVELQILPWEGGEAMRGVAKCFHAWLKERGSNEPAEIVDGIQQVLDFIQMHGAARFEEWGGMSDLVRDPRAGWRKKNDQGNWDYYFMVPGWHEATKNCNAKTIANAMVQKGLLRTGRDGKSSKSLTVPRHGKRRLYHVPAEALSYGTEDSSDDERDGQDGDIEEAA